MSSRKDRDGLPASYVSSPFYLFLISCRARQTDRRTDRQWAMGRRKKRGAGGTLESSPGCDEETVSGGARGITGYELLRQQSIRDNMLRMQKLGIFDLSLSLASDFLPPKRPRRNPPHHKFSLPSPSQPLRRSSRLKSVTPVSYSELRPKKKGQFTKNNEILMQDGSKPEVYSEEHEELLGDCKTSWTLFVDGYNKEGKRIYNQVKGKTCHQCRQKTLGYRTCCSKCKLIQGQFCGDCLYMRYGENVIETNKNPSWICPVCRGICNCSLCRQAKGWMPTGPMYMKVSELGFKSVAHYLIQTSRAKTNSEDPDPEILVSAKTPLPLADTGAELAMQNISLDADKGPDGRPKSQHDNNDDDKYEPLQEEPGIEVHQLETKHVDVNGAYGKDDGNEDDNSGLGICLNPHTEPSVVNQPFPSLPLEG